MRFTARRQTKGAGSVDSGAAQPLLPSMAWAATEDVDARPSTEPRYLPWRVGERDQTLQGLLPRLSGEWATKAPVPRMVPRELSSVPRELRAPHESHDQLGVQNGEQQLLHDAHGLSQSSPWLP
jgi:hypothetical protein